MIENFSINNSDCNEEWRIDNNFLEISEGALYRIGYVPTKEGEVIGQSGVTISTGVDLGQQSRSGTNTILRNYVEKFGNSANVDIDALLDKLDPYFTLKRRNAVDKLKSIPLEIDMQEAVLLEKSFKFDLRLKLERQFNSKNTLKMRFKMLPFRGADDDS